MHDKETRIRFAIIREYQDAMAGARGKDATAESHDILGNPNIASRCRREAKEFRHLASLRVKELGEGPISEF